MNFKITFFLMAGVITLLSCQRQQATFKKEPIDNLVKEYADEGDYSILLYDMNYAEQKDQYQHQYRIIYEPKGADTVRVRTTDWLAVSPIFFEKHIDNLGMALVSKTNGKVEKAVGPPGYHTYVGNEKYGEWRRGSDGNSFWEFYGKYALLSNLFGMNRYPVYYSRYDDYYRNYRPFGRTYYGRENNGGTNIYGTNGRYSKNTSAGNTWQSRPSSFKNNVRSRVSRSASRLKTSRSSGRFRSTGSRSRGGGFGK
jgi:hypothetical protein